MQVDAPLIEAESDAQAAFVAERVVCPTSRTLVSKRVFDLWTALFLVIMCAPFCLLIALLIKLTSPGPAVFCQKRVGKRRAIFSMYKFRSMVENADDMRPYLKELNDPGGRLFKMRVDPRITKIGKWLRAFSLDELPQLINILKGEMSLVGPRPMPIDEVENYNAQHHQRHQVTPGLTGLWQVSGRSDLTFDQMIELDLLYIQKCSLRYDLMILFRTVSVVLLGKGAY